jgi:hypothetical protein
MSTESRDLRASIDVVSDQVLEAVALAKGVTKQEVVRDVLAKWAAQKVHEASLIQRLAPRDGKPRSGTE